jgi:hypothetical protein
MHSSGLTLPEPTFLVIVLFSVPIALMLSVMVRVSGWPQLLDQDHHDKL